MNPFSLEGKTILITGASSGIGASVAVECSRAGATVIITGRNTERLYDTKNLIGEKCVDVITADLLEEDGIKNILDRLPKLNGVFLSAGVNQTLPISFLTRKKLNSIMDVNFFCQVELIRLLVKKKLLNDCSSIVAVASIGGTKTFTPGASAYGASKAALLSFIKTAAKELAPKIRVNCISPGQINTPMNIQREISAEQYERYRNSIPMKRFGEPEEIAYAGIYLLSDASRWVTGTTLIIDGGTTL